MWLVLASLGCVRRCFGLFLVLVFAPRNKKSVAMHGMTDIMHDLSQHLNVYVRGPPERTTESSQVGRQQLKATKPSQAGPASSVQRNAKSFSSRSKNYEHLKDL